MSKQFSQQFRKRGQIWISILLCLTMMLPLTLTSWADVITENQTEQNTTKTIYIETAEEFLSFAEKCRLNTYSVGLKVELESDIDLAGKEFEAIPSFSGIFEGNDHVICGLNLKTEGSAQGLFRYVCTGAVIRNLKLEGSIAPGGSRSSVGSLAGENAGIIQNCSFNGSVSGNDRIGGLVGYNTLTGIIEACTVSGQMQGNHFVGGLAGENNGVIRNCVNEAFINTTVQENKVEMGDISLDSVLESESAVTVTDVGGIAGTNMGVIRECENLGDIGYAKIGYNMGGIAGSQSGYIVESTNRGLIRGRKEVGGIVGQMEPVLKMQFDEDTLQKLEKEMDTLMGLAGQTMTSAQGSITGVTGQMAAMEGYIKEAQSALDLMTPDVTLPEDPALGNGKVDVPGVSVPDLDKILAAQHNLSSSLGRIPGAMDDMVASAQGTLGAFSSSMQTLSNQMTVIGNTVKTVDEDMGGSIVDASDADTAEETGGKVQACTNFGEVSGDLNVGGIVGAMSFESKLDPELDVTITGDLSMNFDGEVRVVVLQCRNEAKVTATKQNGGGIAGRIGLGLVRDCENRGSLQGTAYLGGIAGRADGGYIRQNNTRCVVEGNDYVGGIAGTATVVSDCYSITVFSGAIEKMGGVLGGCEQVTEEIRGNYYLPIDGDVGGIDGISYEGGAQAMNAKQFFNLQRLPEEFRTVTIRFVQEDGSEEAVILDYGEALKAEKIPAVPEKDGAAGRWEGIEELNLSAMCFDVTLRATYDPYEKVIAAAALRADGRPILLAASEFGKDALLKIEELTSEPVSVSDREIALEGWSFEMNSMGETAKLRYLPPEEYAADKLAEDEARIMVRDIAGTWRDVSYTVEGSYLIFEVDQQDEGFCLVYEEDSLWLLYVLAGIGVLVIVEAAIFGLIWFRRRRKAKNAL